MGRGKIERFFLFVDTSFKPEAYQQIQQGRILTLEQLNQALASWVDGYYHIRQHGSTKEAPNTREAASKRQPKRKTLAELTEIFLWEETRKVDKTGCIRLEGNTYEVDSELSGKQVLLRFDPFDLSLIHVWYEGKAWSDAGVVDLTRPYDRRVKPDTLTLVEEQDGQLSFLEAAELKRKAAWEADPVSYADAQGGTKA